MVKSWNMNENEHEYGSFFLAHSFVFFLCFETRHLEYDVIIHVSSVRLEMGLLYGLGPRVSPLIKKGIRIHCRRKNAL